MNRAKSFLSVLQDIGLEDSADDGVAHASKSSHCNRPSPSPLDFAKFLPWLCMGWQSPQVVVVISVVQEEYVSVQDHTSKASKAKTVKRKGGAAKISEEDASDISGQVSSWTSLVDIPLFLTAIFDTKSNLVEIVIKEREIKIDRKTIQAISICIPFHTLLKKLTIRWANLDNYLLYEISKFLPNSFLTDIVLDDTCGQPNYEMLLSMESPLKYLSLNRCLIDDDQCKKIAANIDFGSAGVKLVILELASNLITDEGALALAEVLRRNRNLKHLNLSGNQVTDEGAIPLLSHLAKFPLRLDELMETKRRKIKYLQKKIEMYESIKREQNENLKNRFKMQKLSEAKLTKANNKMRRRRPSTAFDDDIKTGGDAKHLTLQRLGEFIDPFDDCSTISEKQWIYCTGNMVLCSLNLAYNNLSYFSILKIHEVLKYQNEMMICEGLKRIVFDGNQLPVDSNIYTEIHNYLLNTVLIFQPKKHPAKEKSLKSLKASKIKM